MQQGVASDDQSTLHVAELYFRKAYGKRGFRVGQIAPSFGTAWQNVVQTETHHVKITNRLDGPVHVIHSTNASQCEALNLLGRTVRQVVATRVEDDVRPRRFRLESVLTAAQCEAMMEGAGRAARAYCKLGNASAAGAPTIVPAPPVRGVVNAELETLADFLASGRCDRHPRGEPPPKKEGAALNRTWRSVDLGRLRLAVSSRRGARRAARARGRRDHLAGARGARGRGAPRRRGRELNAIL